MAKVDSTALEPTKQEIISSLVLENFTEIGKILPLVNNVSNLVGPGMKSIEFPCIDDFETQKQTYPKTVPGVDDAGVTADAGDAIVCQPMVITTDKLDLDCKSVTGFSYDPCDVVQSVLNVQSELITKAREAILRKIEADLIVNLEGDVDAANVLAPVTPGQISEADLICLQMTLNAKNIPESDRCYLIHPEDLKQVYALKCIKDASVTGDGTSAFRNGQIGTIMGNPVIWSNLVTPGTVMLFHKSSLYYANQSQLMVMENDEPKKSCRVMSMQLPYGRKTIKGGCRSAKLVL